MPDSCSQFQTSCNLHLGFHDRCHYCGSLSPLKAIELLKTPGTRFSGADWKYGWPPGPNKFYLNDHKIYNGHLVQLTDAELAEYSQLTTTALGVSFTKEKKGIKWSAPQDPSFYGHQLWGVIGPDGKPDHSSMNSTNPISE